MEADVKKKFKFLTFLKCALKGSLISMIFTVAVILLFALIIKETGVADEVIRPINQVIKILGIMAASFFAIKGIEEKHWLCGAGAGLLYVLISYFVFSLIDGVMGNVELLFYDLLMGVLIGLVFAILIANFFWKRRPRTGAKSKKGKMRTRKLSI